MYRVFSKKFFLWSVVSSFCFMALLTMSSLPISQAWGQAEDLCPLPSSAISQAPDDLSKVQADIDRFTLCVERAQLLGRLNDLALENQESISALILGEPEEPIVPTFDNSNIPDFSAATQNPVFAPAQATDASFAPSSPSGDAAAAFETAEASPAAAYIVTNVFGSAGNLQAKIVGDDDYNAQVSVGDSLPDGSVIDSISAIEVVISNSGEQIVLDWQEEESE